MGKKQIKFDRLHNLNYATSANSRDNDTIYFPTDSDAIVVGGKEYGCTSVVAAALNNIPTLISTATQSAVANQVATKVDESELSPVAKSGSYDDLDNKPDLSTKANTSDLVTVVRYETQTLTNDLKNTVKTNIFGKEHDALRFSGLGKKYLPMNIQNVLGGLNKNILTQAMVSDANTTYIIESDYNLNGQTINIPNGCILQFEGGSLRNGTIVGNNTKISAELYEIFKEGDITITGTWDIPEFHLEWAGVKSNDSTFDNSVIVNRVSSINCAISLTTKEDYYFAHPIVFTNNNNLKLDAGTLYFHTFTDAACITVDTTRAKNIEINNVFPSDLDGHRDVVGNTNRIGVLIKNCERCTFHLSNIVYFYEAIKLLGTGVGTGGHNGCSYNTFYINDCGSSIHSVRISQDAGGFANENKFIGGSLKMTSDLYTKDPNVLNDVAPYNPEDLYHFYIKGEDTLDEENHKTDTYNTCNAIVVDSMSIEGNCTGIYGYNIHSCSFTNNRHENNVNNIKLESGDGKIASENTFLPLYTDTGAEDLDGNGCIGLDARFMKNIGSYRGKYLSNCPLTTVGKYIEVINDKYNSSDIARVRLQYLDSDDNIISTEDTPHPQDWTFYSSIGGYQSPNNQRRVFFKVPNSVIVNNVQKTVAKARLYTTNNSEIVVNIYSLTGNETIGDDPIINAYDSRDKEYDVTNFSGLGKKYLQKNIQNIGGNSKNILPTTNVSGTLYLGDNKTNTIYTIDSDYDLNGQTVYIPAGCTLSFEGGSLKNGTLHSESADVIINDNGNYGIFSDISFTGELTSSIAKVKWFVHNFPANVADTSIDNTNEIQEALDCGAKFIEFPANKYLHVTSTLQVNNPLDILKEKTNDTVVPSRPIENISVPCIFSDNVITIMQYNCKKSSIYIGDIILACTRSFSTNSDVEANKETPILYIVNTGYGIWGLDVHANICALDYPVIREITIENETSTDIVNVGYYRNNYTGIKIKADRDYIAIANLYGYIHGCYYGVITEKVNTWFNDLTIHGFTVCGIGGKFCNSQGVKIFSNHQSRFNFFEDEAKDFAYFNGANIKLYGMVWDLNLKESGYVVNDSVIDFNTPTSFDVSYTVQQAINDNISETLYNNITSADCDIRITNDVIKHSVVYNKPIFESKKGLSENHNLLDVLLTDGSINELRSRFFPDGAHYYLTKGNDTVDLLDNPANEWMTLYEFNKLFNSVYPSSAYGPSALLDNGAKVILSSAAETTLTFSTTVLIPSYFPSAKLFFKTTEASGATLSMSYSSDVYIPGNGGSNYHHTTISGVTYYYIPIKLKKSQTLTVVDTTHCVLLNSSHNALLGNNSISASEDITVYLSSTTPGNYSRAYTISGIPDVELSVGSWYEDVITIAPYIFEPGKYYHISISFVRPSGLYVILPTIYLYSNADITPQLANNTAHRPRFLQYSGAATNNIGLTFFDTDIKKPVVWNGTDWDVIKSKAYFKNNSTYQIIAGSTNIAIAKIDSGIVYVKFGSIVYKVEINRFFEDVTIQGQNAIKTERLDSTSSSWITGFSYTDGIVYATFNLGSEPAIAYSGGDVVVSTDSGDILLQE